ncbi:ATP-binding protein [Streptomyces sp. NPDC058548]|uniref:ATP-binding protein n=1 Tax=Streptomyces sp. NPDC058548 TaxID=3346545 RepID=UPI0036497392
MSQSTTAQRGIKWMDEGSQRSPETTYQKERLGTVALPALTRPRQGGELTDHERAWPRRMRTAAAEVLCEWGLNDLLRDVQVVVSELVTNAVLHTAASRIAVRMNLFTGTVRIEVDAATDTRSPVRRSPGPEQEHGRGLMIVDELASRWDVAEEGNVVWCEIDYQVTASQPPAQQALTFERQQLPVDSLAGPALARTFVRARATAQGWKGDVEEAARAIGVAATMNWATQLGLAISQDGALLVEIEDEQRGSSSADPTIAAVFQTMVGAEIRWTPTSTGRVGRAALPILRVERVGGAV